MAKLVIDTNVFIDILKVDNKEVKKYMTEIEENIDNYIFPEQIIEETIRNVLKKQKEFQTNMESKYQLYDDKLCKCLKNKEYTSLIKKINRDLVKLRDEEIDSYNDKVECVIMTLSQIKSPNIIKRTSKIIENAEKRKTCGNPPSSHKRIGDEIIWESLLEWAGDSLVIVSNDHTFHDNLKFLQIEYNKKGKQLIAVVDKISDATKLIGKETGKDVVKIERKEEKLTEKIRDDTIKALKTHELINNIFVPSYAPITYGLVTGVENSLLRPTLIANSMYKNNDATIKSLDNLAIGLNTFGNKIGDYTASTRGINSLLNTYLDVNKSIIGGKTKEKPKE